MNPSKAKTKGKSFMQIQPNYLYRVKLSLISLSKPSNTTIKHNVDNNTLTSISKQENHLTRQKSLSPHKSHIYKIYFQFRILLIYEVHLRKANKQSHYSIP